MAVAHSIRWLLVSPLALDWREFDDELLVYNESTGSTHHLNHLGGRILLALLRNPAGMDMPALIESVSDLVATGTPEGVPAAIERVLQELKRLNVAVCTST